MRPFPLLHEEIQQFAEDVAVACRSLRRFISYGEMNEPMVYELREGEVRYDTFAANGIIPVIFASTASMCINDYLS